MKSQISLHQLYQLKQELSMLPIQPNIASQEDKISSIQKKIMSSTITDVIRLGSVFEVSFADQKQETFMLVETTSFKEPEQHFIKLGSHFGNSVIGKREGEHFSYLENDTLVNGTITKIMKKEHYQKVKK